MENLNKHCEIFEILHLLNSKNNTDKNNDSDLIGDSSLVNNNDDKFKSIELYGNIINISNKPEDSKIYNLENETGTGRIKIHTVFSGIQLIYNDMHIEYCNKNQKLVENCIEINHCKEGRYECDFGNRNYCYITPGDMAIGSLNKEKTSSCFPLSHYHGVTIIISLENISKELQIIMNFLSIDLEHIKSNFSDKNNYFVMRANESIEHIFSELYCLKEKSKDGYMKIKVLELLLFLSDLSTEEYLEDKKYYSKNQVDIAKKIKRMITEDISKHYTITQLSDLCEVSESTLKNCFKGVYGTSIYSYLKNYRLTASQRLLYESNDTITKIAVDIGYENPNKFTSAFKKEFGISPSDYRKVILLDRKKFNRRGEKYPES